MENGRIDKECEGGRWNDLKKRYEVGMVLCVLGFMLIIRWDFFYYVGGYEINWGVDLGFRVVVLGGMWVV